MIKKSNCLRLNLLENLCLAKLIVFTPGNSVNSYVHQRIIAFIITVIKDIIKLSSDLYVWGFLEVSSMIDSIAFPAESYKLQNEFIKPDLPTEM